MLRRTLWLSLSLVVGILPVIFAFVIGTSLGLVAGYVGGRINTAIMRTTASRLGVLKYRGYGQFSLSKYSYAEDVKIGVLIPRVMRS